MRVRGILNDSRLEEGGWEQGITVAKMLTVGYIGAIQAKRLNKASRCRNMTSIMFIKTNGRPFCSCAVTDEVYCYC